MHDHLETAMVGLLESGADFVSTLGISIRRNGPNLISGEAVQGRFIPAAGIPASLWLLKKAVLEEVGPWRHPRECRLMPSQDLLIRIWRAGKRIRTIPKITVIAVPSGARPQVYAARESDENRRLFENLSRDPRFLETELMKIVGGRAFDDAELSVWKHVRHGLFNAAKKIAVLFGVTPLELSYLLRLRRKGHAINRWRKTIGLNKLK